MSPTAQTRSTPRTRPYASTGTNPPSVDGQPGDRGALEPRQRDREVDVERPLELEPQPAVVVLLGERAGPQLHARRASRSRHRDAGLGAEDVRAARTRASRARSGDRAPAGVRTRPSSGRARRAAASRRRPCRATKAIAWRRPGTSASIASRTAATSRGPANVIAPGTRDSGLGAQRQQQRVVAHRRPVPGDRARASSSRTASQHVRDPAHAAVARDALPVVARAPDRRRTAR